MCAGVLRPVTVVLRIFRHGGRHPGNLGGLGADEGSDGAHGDAGGAAGLELGEAVVADGRERARRRVVVRHAAGAGEHQVHHAGVDAPRAGDARALADVAETAGDAAAEGGKHPALPGRDGGQAVGRVAPPEVGEAAPGAEEGGQQRAHEGPCQDEQGVEAAHVPGP